jgi:peptidyl-prolyl cis-trans isomerase B (cyclophilin B)
MTNLIELLTSAGTIKIQLDEEKAPKTVENFINYLNQGHYDGTIFHRVIKGFMIQGGGFDENMAQKNAAQTIENEANNGLKNTKYSIAMARTSDPHSASAQFFINCGDNEFLNYKSSTPNGWGYAVFGQVIEGKEIVDSIEKAKTSRKGFHDDVPVENVIINKIILMN